MRKSYTINIFLPSGDASGLRILRRPNWTGVGLAFSRTGFQEASSRSELSQPGVYVLVGNMEESSLPMVYIGEGDPVINRLIDHNRNKDFWEWAVVFSSTDNSINKAFVQHLESRLIDIAQGKKRCNLTNNVFPKRPTLTESDHADMENFLDNMLSIFPLVGLSIFENSKTLFHNKPKDTFHISGREGADATAIQQPNGFVVLKNSKAALTVTTSISPYLVKLRQDLVKKDVLAEKNGLFIFGEDYSFSSPSLAASVVLGRNTNGRSEWKNSDGKSLNDLAATAVAIKTLPSN